MHTEAFAFIKQFATSDPVEVIEIGSRNINGTVRKLFPNATWTGLDLYAGRDVDWVGNALEYDPKGLVDVVICCEVFEHTQQWRELVSKSASWLRQSGELLITCAGNGRTPHSHVNGGKLRRGEHYANLTDTLLRDSLVGAGLRAIVCHQLGEDVQAAAIKV